MKVLVVDDEKNVRRLVGDCLKNEGIEVIEASGGYECIDYILVDQTIDLVLLDVRMPKMDGFETLKEIKRIADIPVIFLTGNGDVSMEIKSLKLGAYDYITKPFSYEVLVARVESCMNQLKKAQPEILNIEGLKINLSNREVTINGENIGVTQKEFDVLELLIMNKNISLNRNNILNKVWGFDYFGDQRTVDTHIKTLRAKMKTYGTLIKTVRGVGYFIEMD